MRRKGAKDEKKKSESHGNLKKESPPPPSNGKEWEVRLWGRAKCCSSTAWPWPVLILPPGVDPCDQVVKFENISVTAIVKLWITGWTAPPAPSPSQICSLLMNPLENHFLLFKILCEHWFWGIIIIIIWYTSICRYYYSCQICDWLEL